MTPEQRKHFQFVRDEMHGEPQPAQKPWVGLTDDERNVISRHHAYVDNIIKATEDKIKEKNT